MSPSSGLNSFQDTGSKQITDVNNGTLGQVLLISPISFVIHSTTLIMHECHHILKKLT